MRNSFNTQPRGGGCSGRILPGLVERRFQHTAARRRLPSWINMKRILTLFQHTAARRRLQSPSARRF